MDKNGPCTDERPERKRHGIGFYVWLTAIFLIGAAMIFFSHWLPSYIGHFAELIRDLGIAACISVIIARIIELKLAQETFVDAFDAIMKGTISIPIWNYFRQQVIIQPLLRLIFFVTMTIDGKESGHLLSRTKVTYTLEALTYVEVTTISHSRDIHRIPKKEFCQIRVGMDEPIDCIKLRSNDGSRYQFKVKNLQAKETKEVEYEFNELINYLDTIVWTMNLSTLCGGIEIIGLSDDCNVEVKLHHPPDYIIPSVKKNKWVFKKAFLPGQGFEIRLSCPEEEKKLCPPTNDPNMQSD